MAYVPSQKTRFYVGPLHFSVYARGVQFHKDRMMIETTALTDTAHVFTPGQTNATLSLDLMLDGSAAAGSEFATINTWETTPQPLTLGPSGMTAGSESWLVQANSSKATFKSVIADVATVAVDVQCDGGHDPGVILDPETAYTANNTTTAIDNGAATANGGVAHLHVTAFTGFTSDTILVEHSTDNISFATLGTFQTVTGTTSERLVIAAGTTVNRYVRVKDTVVGSGSVTRTVAFARR